MQDAFCLAGSSKFVTSVYHLHPSRVNKHVICAAFPGPPTHPFHWQHTERIKPSGQSIAFFLFFFLFFLQRTLWTTKADWNSSKQNFMTQDIFFFYPIPGHCCTFVLARPQWLRDRDDRGNYIARENVHRETKTVMFFPNVGLKQTAGGTDPNITPYYSFERNQPWCWFCATGARLHCGILLFFKFCQVKLISWNKQSCAL